MTKFSWKKFAGSVIDFGGFVVLCVGLAQVGTKAAMVQSGLLATFIFLAASYALTTIITQSEVAWPISQAIGRIPVVGQALYREDKDGDQSGLLTCPLCTGMWLGVGLAAIGVGLYPIAAGLTGARDLAVHGLIASGWSYAIHKLIDKE